MVNGKDKEKRKITIQKIFTKAKKKKRILKRKSDSERN